MAIGDFSCKETKRIYDGDFSRKLPGQIQESARRKLRIIEAAMKLEDLRVPPGNQLESLKGDRAGQHSIRINQQWRICFVWDGDKAKKIEIVDYH